MKLSYEQIHFKRIFRVFNVSSIISMTISSFALLASSLKSNLVDIQEQLALSLQILSIINFVNCLLWLFAAIVILANVSEIKKVGIINSTRMTKAFLFFSVPLILLANIAQIIVLFLNEKILGPETVNIMSTAMPILISFGFLVSQGVTYNRLK
ncbi:MAG: hypothetical protein MJ207_01280 [Bacilli bacterium]|nr:hypothetical protein [Bacilli bacterium]